MEEKLRRLMKHEGINSTRLAEMLGIQASGISHIMSGRNKPSYDFLLKLLQRFPQLNPDWLLLDKGPMYRDEIKKSTTSAVAAEKTGVAPGAVDVRVGATAVSDMFAPYNTGGTNTADSGNSTITATGTSGDTNPVKTFEPDNDDIIPAARPVAQISHPGKQLSKQQQSAISGGRSSSIERIVVFYNDRMFAEYQPEPVMSAF